VVVYFSADLRSMDRPNYAVDSSRRSLAAYRMVAAQWRWEGALEDIRHLTAKSLVATTAGLALCKTSFKATFSERMNSNTLTQSTFKIFKCPTATSNDCTIQVTDVTLARSTDGLSVILNPHEGKTTLLSAGTRYKVVVTTEAKDAAGNALDQDPFKAGRQPRVAYFKTASS
jgi:L-arabinose isomerase